MDQDEFDKAWANFDGDDGSSRLCKISEEQFSLDISNTQASRILEKYFGFNNHNELPD